MTNINTLVVSGRLTANAEVRTSGNSEVVNFTIAVNRGQNSTSFIPVRAAKNYISDKLMAKLVKGAGVVVQGRFESGSYEKDGERKYYNYIAPTTIQAGVPGSMASGILMGNLTADPITRKTTTGKDMVTFTIANNRSYRDKNGEWKDAAPAYINCAAYDQAAQFIAKYIKKGSSILVSGELTSHQYQSKDGKNRTSYEFNVTRASSASDKNEGNNAEPAQNKAAQKPAAPAAPTYGNYGADDFEAVADDEDLPF